MEFIQEKIGYVICLVNDENIPVARLQKNTFVFKNIHKDNTTKQKYSFLTDEKYHFSTIKYCEKILEPVIKKLKFRHTDVVDNNIIKDLHISFEDYFAIGTLVSKRIMIFKVVSSKIYNIEISQE